MSHEESSLITPGGFEPESLRRTRPQRSVRKVGRKVGITLLLALAALYFVPWQQSISGSGQVTVYDAMSRPQTVQAQISGRVVAWHVQEGDVVKKGQLIATLEDIDPKFLDQNQVKRLREQRDFAALARKENLQRLQELGDQRAQLDGVATAATAAAEQGVAQAIQRRKAAMLSVRQAQQALRIAREVARETASELRRQAEDRIIQAEQDLVAAKEKENTMKLRRDRIEYLRSEGLRSGQDFELANNDWVRAQSDRKLAEKALEIAKKDRNVKALAEDRTSIEVRAAQASVEKAQADLAVADREIINARLNVGQVMGETQATLSRVAADMQSAKESAAKTAGEVRKIEVELSTVQFRTDQREIRAPATGRVARLLKVGESASVKAGDELAIIVPETNDRVVELFVLDNDVPLLDVGRPVRLQFAGWPALQFVGWPAVAVGSFGGRIKVIDPLDDGSARYRILVEPDIQRLPGGRMDEPWPSPDRLRPGAEAAGWVLLDTVPLGYELWRNFNGFPPRVRSTPPLMGKKLDEPLETKDPQLGPIKLKTK